MDKTRLLIVDEKDSLKRIDTFLAERCLDLSRSKVGSLIERGCVEVNGKLVKKNSYRVASGDSISIRSSIKNCSQEVDIKTELDQEQDQVLDSDFDDYTYNQEWETQLKPKEYPINVVYEDEFILVVDKPAGMVVHPGVKTGDKVSLVEAVRYYLLSKGGVDNRVSRAGLVHRLDQDTSGLIVFAKDEPTHTKLAAQFKNKTNLREYTALLSGYLKEDRVDVESYLVRSKFNRMSFRSLSAKELEDFTPLSPANQDSSDRFIVNYKGETKYRIVVDKNGRKARYSCSHFIKKASYDHKLSLVTVRLDTGRTHQIRVHAKDIGAPVVADKLYSKPQKLLSIDPLIDTELKKVPRQLLHAGVLGIVHPKTGEKICFRSELPQEFQKVLYLLEKLEDN